MFQKTNLTHSKSAVSVLPKKTKHNNRSQVYVHPGVFIGTYFFIAITFFEPLLIDPNSGKITASWIIVHGVGLLYVVITHILFSFNNRAGIYSLLLFYILFAAGIGLSLDVKSSFGNVLVYCAAFGMLVTVLWFYGRKTMRAMVHAEQRAKALLQQKIALKSQNTKYIKRLHKLQLKELQQVYRFAELGQDGMVLLHSLANNLTALTLEMEETRCKQQSTAAAPTEQLVQRLVGLVNDAKERLGGSTHKQKFGIVIKINEAIAFLQHKAEKSNIEIVWQPPAHSWECWGDPNSFCQIITIVTNNAIDAYSNQESKLDRLLSKNQVVIDVQKSDTHSIIKITDWGKGITKIGRKHLFEPFHSTKKSGLGLGLYIAKQITELQFLGSIELNPAINRTEFVIKLPFKS